MCRGTRDAPPAHLRPAYRRPPTATFDPHEPARTPGRPSEAPGPGRKRAVTNLTRSAVAPRDRPSAARRGDPSAQMAGFGGSVHLLISGIF
ncbi:hypothetical protein GCM10022214_76160 [Actinomadura miaoliensis]|uniref:Uncharacterized protein n=1 Tax=Actinomadura miaoliensis TaxID=430685 RepID=A0ABP7WYJ1_9ACTN